MIIISYDTETALIAPGLLAPPMTCMTWHIEGEPEAHIAHWTTSEPILRGWLEDPNVFLVGQNVAFDMGVISQEFPDLLPLVFQVYKDKRVADTMLQGQLLDIAAGLFKGWADEKGKWHKPKYSLFDLVRRYSGRLLQKDGWRMMYSYFRDVPLDRWVEHATFLQANVFPPLLVAAERACKLDPNADNKQAVRDLQEAISSPPETCLSYPKDDATSTLDVHLHQMAHAEYMPDRHEQVYAAWCQHLQSAWGMITDPAGVRNLEAAVRTEQNIIKERLINAGLVRPDGTRDLKAAALYMKEVCFREELPVRLTDKGGICLDKDACEETDDPTLKDYAKFAGMNDVLKKDIPLLYAGNTLPVQPRISLLVSGREAQSKPNLQNLRRGGGTRDCFIPRPGKVFLQADYPGLELRTVSQTCLDLFRFSAMGEMINAGIDPHLAFAAKMLHISYDEAAIRLATGDKEVDHYRNIAKVFNFGKFGGMGNKKFVIYLAGYGIILSLDEVAAYDKVWKETFPEAKMLFDHVSRLTAASPDGLCTIELPRSKRRRGGCWFTAACNGYFQGPGADVTKRARQLIAEACYVDTRSPLYSSRNVNTVHDEFILESPLGPGMHDAAEELGILMAKGANEYVPDVPFAPIQALAMSLWAKKAKRILGPDGRLAIWSPALLTAKAA